MADYSSIRKFANAADYTKNFIIQAEIDKYLPNGRHFIDDALINRLIEEIALRPADPSRVREIIAKSESTCETLLPEETAVLMSAASDSNLFAEMRAAALRIKKKVYDNRIVVFCAFVSIQSLRERLQVLRLPRGQRVATKARSFHGRAARRTRCARWAHRSQTPDCRLWRASFHFNAIYRRIN